MSKEIGIEIAEHREYLDKLKSECEELTEKKKALLLKKNSVADINAELRKKAEEIEDIQNILLPELNERLARAKKAEAEELRQKTIKQILNEEMELQKQGQDIMMEFAKCYDTAKRGVQRIDQINRRHNQIAGQLSRLGGMHPQGFGWQPLIVPRQFRALANLRRTHRQWVEKYRGKE